MPVAKKEKEGKRRGKEKKKKKRKARRLVVGYTVLNTTRREIYRKRVTSVRSISVARTKSPLISRTNCRLCAAVLHLDARISPPLLRNARQVYQVRAPSGERALHAMLPCIATKHGRGKQGGLLIGTAFCVWKGIETLFFFDEILSRNGGERRYGNATRFV